MNTQLKAPFPYFGGKSSAAPEVWRRFGTVNNYIEPFCGSLAVLLAREEVQGYETVNDKSCFISNFWRAVQSAPDEVARHCQFPVSEVDLHARHSWLMFSDEVYDFREKLSADPDFYDAKIAGWWVWGMCIWIGAGWCGERALTKEGKLKKQIPNAHGQRHCQKKNILKFLQRLSERILKVRICNGEWHRVCSSKSATTALGTTGIFFDPPYAADTGRDMRLYAEESGTVAEDVRQWCIDNRSNSKIRIALCGYEGEHNLLEKYGWTVHGWKAHGGYGNRNKENNNRKQERIWFSPACLTDRQMDFDF